MIKRFHEAPKSIFRTVQQYTDGDYALVHLFDSDPEYYKLFEEAVALGREVILDNSLFELGKSFDEDKFAHWVEKLKPTYYVVPDVMDDGPGTIKAFDEFMSKHPNLPGKTMGVVHGKNYEEFEQCYRDMVKRCDKVCFSLDNPWWHTNLVDGKNVYDAMATMSDYETNKRWCHDAMAGRIRTLHWMLTSGVIDTSKPHHLLGCLLPQEVKFYKYYDWIESVDTSNPVVFGMHFIGYNDAGMTYKIGDRMCDMMNEHVIWEKRNFVIRNIQKFKEFCNG